MWYQTFLQVPDDKFETAIRLTLLNCKYFPNVREINAAVLELNEVARTSQQHYPALPIARASQAMVKKIVEMSKKDLRATVSNFDVSGLMETARYYFKDITKETVQRNLSEFITMMQQTDACWNCKMTNYCPMGSYRHVPKMHASGYIILEVVKCEKRHVKTAG